MSVPHALLVLASPNWGGTERAVVELANALGRLGRVSVAVPHTAEYLGRFSEAVDVRTLRPGSRRNPLVVSALARTIRDVQPDVVHAHAARASEMAFWASRLHAAPLVATKHNTRPRWIFPRIRWVTAVSEAAAATVRHPIGVEVVYNGVDVSCPAQIPKPETFTVLGVGRLHRHKGFDTLLRALAPLPIDWRLRLAGEGSERGALEELARREGVADRLELLGHRDDVPSLLRAAHVLAVSSRTEGFSLALVEGLQCCDVVISTRVGIAPEILPEALLVEPDELGERLADVCARHDDYEAVTAAVRAEIGDRFRLEHAVDRYVAIYRRAMTG